MSKTISLGDSKAVQEHIDGFSQRLSNLVYELKVLLFTFLGSFWHIWIWHCAALKEHKITSSQFLPLHDLSLNWRGCCDYYCGSTSENIDKNAWVWKYCLILCLSLIYFFLGIYVLSHFIYNSHSLFQFFKLTLE